MFRYINLVLHNIPTEYSQERCVQTLDEFFVRNYNKFSAYCKLKWNGSGEDLCHVANEIVITYVRNKRQQSHSHDREHNVNVHCLSVLESFFSNPGRIDLMNAFLIRLMMICQVLVFGFSTGPDMVAVVAISLREF